MRTGTLEVRCMYVIFCCYLRVLIYEGCSEINASNILCWSMPSEVNVGTMAVVAEQWMCAVRHWVVHFSSNEHQKWLSVALNGDK